MASLVPFFLVTGAVFLVLVVALFYVAREVLRWVRVACPERGRDADIALHEIGSGQKAKRDVMRCSLLGSDAPVTCDKACLKRFEQAA
jgi:hypothetical protein